jgi:hypothetical protein
MMPFTYPYLVVLSKNEYFQKPKRGIGSQTNLNRNITHAKAAS